VRLVRANELAHVMNQKLGGAIVTNGQMMKFCSLVYIKRISLCVCGVFCFKLLVVLTFLDI
jgi:hypothetical protein